MWSTFSVEGHSKGIERALYLISDSRRLVESTWQRRSRCSISNLIFALKTERYFLVYDLSKWLYIHSRVAEVAVLQDSTC